MPEIPWWLSLVLKWAPIPPWLKSLIPILWATVQLFPIEKLKWAASKLHDAHNIALSSNDPSVLSDAVRDVSDHFHNSILDRAK